MLPVIPQIDNFPHAVIARKEASLKLLSLIGRTRCLGGTILENDLCLRQILDDCRIRSKQDQGCIRHAVVCDCAAIMEKLPL